MPRSFPARRMTRVPRSTASKFAHDTADGRLCRNAGVHGPEHRTCARPSQATRHARQHRRRLRQRQWRRGGTVDGDIERLLRQELPPQLRTPRREGFILRIRTGLGVDIGGAIHQFEGFGRGGWHPRTTDHSLPGGGSRGVRTDTFAYVTDVVPTLLEFAGVRRLRDSSRRAGRAQHGPFADRARGPRSCAG